MSTRPLRQPRFIAPPNAADILLIRHGESAAAVPGLRFDLMDGQGDPPLAPEGQEQAERVGARLREEKIDAIYVTTLRRTAQTAAPLAAALGIEPVVEPDLREVHLGEWEGGLFRQKVAAGDPVALRMRAEQRWDVIPGAEPAEAFERRVRAGIERLAAAHPGQRVAVFTHGGVIGAVIAAAAKSAAFAFVGADNGSISQVVVDGSTWYTRRFNDTAHLPDEPGLA
ncbi:histidine phosphatase family protein [Alloactinosynnema sp. L-07]|uniref:histidine phosphatase family protein n=1 Tax=Alloactinosynnema sp. L-07 TaxID=1653480 RepID=UPI001E304F0F|nr:histidine phosphatase family protein [Alloactinosynnema sp. L-07]